MRPPLRDGWPPAWRRPRVRGCRRARSRRQSAQVTAHIRIAITWLVAAREASMSPVRLASNAHPASGRSRQTPPSTNVPQSHTLLADYPQDRADRPCSGQLLVGCALIGRAEWTWSAWRHVIMKSDQVTALLRRRTGPSMSARSRGIAPSVRPRPARRADGGHAWRRLRAPFLVPAGVVVVLMAVVVAVQGGASPLLIVRSPSPVATPTADQASFIQRVGGVARHYRAVVGLPPSLVTAMAINETGWGTSELASRARNYFGIKADVGEGTAGRVVEDTHEVVDGRVVSVRAAFRAYRSLEESTQDLGTFLRANSRYDAIWARAWDPHATALALAQAGYATDPDWAGKLIALIDGFNLEGLDTPDWWPSSSRI